MALGKTISELFDTMSGKELSAWIQYYSEEPFGEKRADYRMGLNTHILASPYLKKEHKLNDFILQFGKEEKPTQEELKQKIKVVLGKCRKSDQ